MFVFCCCFFLFVCFFVFCFFVVVFFCLFVFAFFVIMYSVFIQDQWRIKKMNFYETHGIKLILRIRSIRDNKEGSQAPLPSQDTE